MHISSDVEQLVSIFLGAIIVILASAIACTKKIEKSILLLSVMSGMLALLYVVLSAPDVAMTEASVGAAMSSVLMIIALSKMKEKESCYSMPSSFLWGYGILFCLIGMAVCVLLKSIPIHHYIPIDTASFYYNTYSREEIGIANHVTSILASYRGYDTLAETMVILIAALSVRAHLGNFTSAPFVKKTSDVAQAFMLLHVKNTIIFLLPFLFLFAFYIQFYGENSPGGGFQSGIICASGFILIGLLHGVEVLKKIIPLKWLTFLASGGVLLYGSVGLMCMIRKGNFLEYKMLFPKNPHLGETIGIMMIEIGVALTVFSAMVLFIILFSERKNPRDAISSPC